MTINSSSPYNSSLDSTVFDCSNYPFKVSLNTAFNITRAVLLLPLSILILFLGHQQWRQQRSFAKTSHSDIFTFHMAAMDLIWGFGTGLLYCSPSNDVVSVTVLYCLCSITFYGETFFHLLTCAERYLAVVHPITYLGLRKARGVRIRNICIGCVWLLSSALSCLTSLPDHNSTIIPFSILLVFSLVAVTFLSLSVLRGLTRPGPGDGGPDRERGDRSKEKAFFTIMTIMGVLWFWFSGYLVSYTLKFFPLLSHSNKCLLISMLFWFSLPSSLVLPLLYLHRAEKLPWCC